MAISPKRCRRKEACSALHDRVRNDAKEITFKKLRSTTEVCQMLRRDSRKAHVIESLNIIFLVSWGMILRHLAIGLALALAANLCRYKYSAATHTLAST